MPTFVLGFAPCTARFYFPERHLLLTDELIPGRLSAVSLVLGVIASGGQRAAYVGGNGTIVYDPWASSGPPAPLGLLVNGDVTSPSGGGILPGLLLVLVWSTTLALDWKGLSPSPQDESDTQGLSRIVLRVPKPLPIAHLMVRWATKAQPKGSSTGPMECSWNRCLFWTSS